LSEILIDEDDIHGHGVNLAARLMALASPGEIVVSQRVRDGLTPDLDAEVEDLGDCFLRHVSQPVRAYRIGPAGPRSLIRPSAALDDLSPSIAVIPLEAREPDGHHVVGEIFAEELIRALSQSPEFSVMSRLSTTALRGRGISLADIVAHLRADYVLSGTYRYAGETVILDIELADVKSGQVLWTDHIRSSLSALLDEEQELINGVATKVIVAVSARELKRSRSQSPPTLRAYTLLMGAITLMHRLSRQDFDEALNLLQVLVDRGTRQPIPHAWLAYWHVLRVQQGWSIDEKEDAYLALESTKRALDSDPDCSLALAVDGFVHTNLLKKLDVAAERYKLALAANPSNPLAWTLRGALNAFTDNGQQAVDDTQRALKLTPLDPHRYFYDSLSASACIAARDYGAALELARRSLRANRKHTSTLRVMSVAQWHLGLRKEARLTAKELLKLEPTLTVSRWLKRAPSAPYKVGQEFARVLRKVGVPN
jgi:adenylate cyclase